MRIMRVTALLVLTCLFGLSVGARAHDVVDGVIVTVPFDFVAGGVTFVAGQYRINCVKPGVNRELVIHSYSNGGEFVLLVTFDGVITNQSTLSFEHIGGRYFLSKIKIPGGVYSMKTPSEKVALAQAKSQSNSSSSGTN